MKRETYRLVRSRRKTLAICVDADGNVIVRAPLRMPQNQIEAFVAEKSGWVERTVEKQRAIASQRERIRLTPQQVKLAREEARRDLTRRCRRFESIIGVRCSGIEVNGAKSRWGSCNSKGIIHFTYRLLFAPEPLRDYVVVHELAHLVEMNHSERFWKQVERVMPDYRQRRLALKQFQQRVVIMEGTESYEDRERIL